MKGLLSRSFLLIKYCIFTSSFAFSTCTPTPRLSSYDFNVGVRYLSLYLVVFFNSRIISVIFCSDEQSKKHLLIP